MAMTPAEVKLAKVLMDNGYSFFESAAILGAVSGVAEGISAEEHVTRIGSLGMGTLVKYAGPTMYRAPMSYGPTDHVEGVPER